MSYKQKSKQRARSDALSHAVALATWRREQAPVVARDHVRRVRDILLHREGGRDALAASSCKGTDIARWETLRDSLVGHRSPTDLTVAFFSGPEPTNDLDTLVDLGVQPENIWAFESDKGTYTQALEDLKIGGARGVKILRTGLEPYISSAPRKFDIIYIDACGPLPSRSQNTLRLLATIFLRAALSSPGIIVTNFARPDIDDPVQLNEYSHLISSYLYPKGFRDCEKGGWIEGAEAYSFVPRDDANIAESFFHYVQADFDHHYGSYITRQIIDLPSLVTPMMRLANAPGLWKLLFNEEPKTLSALADRLLRFPEENSDETLTADYSFDGSAISEASEHSLL
jgi:hypothetical protein